MDEIAWYVIAGGLVILLAILLYVFVNPPKSAEPSSDALPMPTPPPDAPPQPVYPTGPLPMPPLDSREKALPGGGAENRQAGKSNSRS